MVMSKLAERSNIQFHRLQNVLLTDLRVMVIHHFIEKHLAPAMNNPAQAALIITGFSIIKRRTDL
jgi:hypothetical protein